MNQYRNNLDPTSENPFGTITQIVEKPEGVHFNSTYLYANALEQWKSSQSIRIPLTFKTDKEVLVEDLDFELKNCDCVIGQDCKNKSGKWFTPCKVAAKLSQSDVIKSAKEFLNPPAENEEGYINGLAKEVELIQDIDLILDDANFGDKEKVNQIDKLIRKYYGQ